MYDPLFVEMFDESEPITPTPGRTAVSPLDDPLFQFQRSTGAAELLAAQLEARHLAEELLGTEAISKRIREGLFDLTPGAARPPIDTNTFRQEPLPEPSATDESGVRMCDCKCERCQKDDCKSCAAESKCKFSRCEDAEKTVAAMVGELRGRLHPHARNVPKETWRGLERAMLRYVAQAVSSAV